MKKITVIGYEEATDIGHPNPTISSMELVGDEKMDASDGYHTFTELYEHRITLFIALCRILNEARQQDTQSWRSKLHSDGSSFPGWFVMGIGELPGEQITYHLPLSKWNETEFAATRERAPEWDGHSSNDVLTRLASLLLEVQ